MSLYHITLCTSHSPVCIANKMWISKVAQSNCCLRNLELGLRASRKSALYLNKRPVILSAVERPFTQRRESSLQRRIKQKSREERGERHCGVGARAKVKHPPQRSCVFDRIAKELILGDPAFYFLVLPSHCFCVFI